MTGLGDEFAAGSSTSLFITANVFPFVAFLESKKMKAKYELLVSELQMQRFPRQTQLLPLPSAICHLVLCHPHVAAPKL
jgi:hypothetical protein